MFRSHLALEFGLRSEISKPRVLRAEWSRRTHSASVPEWQPPLPVLPPPSFPSSLLHSRHRSIRDFESCHPRRRRSHRDASLGAVPFWILPPAPFSPIEMPPPAPFPSQVLHRRRRSYPRLAKPRSAPLPHLQRRWLRLDARSSGIVPPVIFGSRKMAHLMLPVPSARIAGMLPPTAAVRAPFSTDGRR
jgi:hypothetical protein